MTRTYYWPEVKEKMTEELARAVKDARISDEETWRGIASRFGTSFDLGDLRDNQLLGMDICAAAAEWFGEDYSQKPWN